MPRQQFNVNLDSELVRRVKHHAIDVHLSLSDLVSRVLTDHLDNRKATTMAQHNGQLSLQPMVHVELMAPAVALYEALGGELLHGSRDGDFVMMRIGDTQLGLLAHPPNLEQNEGTVELNFETARPLEELEASLRRAGVAIASPTSDEGFGRQLQVQTPDGLLVKINQLDPELYTRRRPTLTTSDVNAARITPVPRIDRCRHGLRRATPLKKV